MFYCLTTILSIIFYNSLICLSFVIEIFYFQTVPGTKHHRFILGLTFFSLPSFFRHQKDSGRQSIYKGENLYDVSCILGFFIQSSTNFVLLGMGAVDSSQQHTKVTIRYWVTYCDFDISKAPDAFSCFGILFGIACISYNTKCR